MIIIYLCRLIDISCLMQYVEVEGEFVRGGLSKSPHSLVWSLQEKDSLIRVKRGIEHCSRALEITYEKVCFITRLKI